MVDSKPVGAHGIIDLSCCWSQKGCHLILVLLCVLLPITLSLPCAVDEHLGSSAGDALGSLGYEDGSGSHGEGVDLDIGSQRSSLGCEGVRHVCSRGGSFCFLSTLPGLSHGEDNREAISLGDFGSSGGITDTDSGLFLEGRTVYRLSDGKNVSCSFMGMDGEHHTQFSRNSEDVNRNDAGLCRGPLPPDAWMQISSGMGDITPAGIDSASINSSSSPHAVVNPPLLDWGINHLYFPSFAYLTVSNMHNDSALHVFEPFSTDPQFYLHGFEEFTLAPGEVASIAFVFLPRWLGSSSAHLVLQTSFGGFIINAKGIAIDSPFRIQPLAGFKLSKSGRLTKSLSLYNPFDEVLFVEEVALWVSVASKNVSHSSHVFCHADAFQQSSDDLNASAVYSEWPNKMKNSYSRSLVGMKPHGKWEVSPHHTEMILGMTLVPHVEGNVTGVLCMQLRNYSCDKVETVMVPLETEMHYRIGYQAVTSSVSIFLDPIVWCDGNGSTFMMSVRNDGSELLRLVDVSEVTEREKLFHISHMDGLMLYPGTLTRVALIVHSSFHEYQDLPSDISGQDINCKIQVVTNDTISSYIDIPCQALVHAPSGQDRESRCTAVKESYLGSRRLEESTNSRIEFSRSIFEENLPTELVLELLKATELILDNWKSQSITTEMSVLEDAELIFSTVEVGNHSSKWIRVKNPSRKPVVMQLLLNSGAVIDRCRTADDTSQHYIFSRFDHMNSMEIVDGFSLPKAAVIEAFVHPFERAILGPIVYHPSDRCMWRSSALVRNNLSGVEWLPLQGRGGSKSLALFEDSTPVHKLDFNLDWSMPLNRSSVEPKFRKESKSATCAHSLSKELLVKNTGELPLEIVKLQVSGNSCELDGFRVHPCKGFSLAPGQSITLHISYQPDFSAAVIQKDLEFALASGIIVIPMRSSIPVYMIKLCRKSFIWSFLRMLSFVAFAGFFITALFFLLPFISEFCSQGHLMKSNTIATVNKVGKPTRVHRNPRNARTSREDPKAEVIIIRKYTDNHQSVQDSTQNLLAKQDLDCQSKVPVIPPSEARSNGEERCGTSENSRNPDLAVRIGREKGKRRKKRVSGMGTGSAAKVEVSSSQSGNSTPSSPISPSAVTPKQVWPLSPDSKENPFTRGLVGRNIEKNKVIEGSLERIVQADSMKRFDHTWQPPSHEQLPIPRRQAGKSILTPSATFPRSGWRAPVVATPSLLALTSPMPPHSRAPGSKLSKDTVVKRDEKPMHGKEFTYDIWGNHLCDHIMGRSRELSPTAFSEASEGDSLSLFTRGPQSLVKMSSHRSVSPGPKVSSYDVNYNHQVA